MFRGNGIRENVTFGKISFGEMVHLGKCISGKRYIRRKISRGKGLRKNVIQSESTQFIKFMCEKLLPPNVWNLIDASEVQHTRQLRVLDVFAEMCVFCGTFDNPAEKVELIADYCSQMRNVCCIPCTSKWWTLSYVMGE